MNKTGRENGAARRSHLSKTVIRDVAQEAGVSIATVSRALNGKTDVASTTRARVLHIAQQKGYMNNHQARALAGRRLIGLTVPQVSSPHFAEIMQGAAEALEEYEASLVICPTAYRSEREKSLLDRLQGGVDGALLVLPAESDSELLQLAQRGYPFVIVDPTIPVSDTLLVVAAANMAGARQASEHLLSLGHRRIGIITGPARWCATIDRLAGYHAALASAGLPGDPSLVITADFSLESGWQAARDLLDLSPPPTAIFAFNDKMAAGVLRAAEERSLCVPEDLSVVGFDDGPFATYTRPALTTVHQPTRELGRIGVGQLFRQLQGQVIESRRVELSTTLVVRSSTCPAPDYM